VTDVLRIFHAIGESAVSDRMDEMVASLLNQHIPRDVLHLENSATQGTIQATGSEQRLFARAILNWMEEWFGLVSQTVHGTIEVPLAQLDSFDILNEPSEPIRQNLVRLKVVSPGWIRRGKVVVLPTAELL